MQAWHGTHRQFEAFSTNYIGTGEGGDGLGWGLYFSENREGGEYFARYAAASKGTGYLYRVTLDLQEHELIHLGTEDSAPTKHFLWSQYDDRKLQVGNRVYAKLLLAAHNHAVLAEEGTKPSHGKTILCLSPERVRIDDVFSLSPSPYEWVRIRGEA
jgi:hypothetical protein